MNFFHQQRTQGLMAATKQKRLLLGGLWMMVMLVAVYYLRAPEHAVATPDAHVESTEPEAKPQSHADGLQWMGALEASTPERQQDPRTLGERIAALAATRDPADALQAYQMMEACELQRPVFDMDPMPPVFLLRKKQCATINEVMRRSRHDYLRAAAYAGVPGAGSDWLRYGPSGDMEALRTRPDDPSVAEWKRQAVALVTRDADRGDFNALQDLMIGYRGKTPLFEADPSRELAYAMAYKDVVDVLHLAPIYNQPTDVELEAIATKLSAEQLAWAKAKAAAIVAARSKRVTPASR
jgi:hypothetical protein